MTATTFTFADGRTVSRLGFGAMRLTGQPGNFGPFRDPEAGKALLRKARDLGVQHFDTARAYGPHHSERLIRDAFGDDLPDLFIATKGGIEKSGAGQAHIRRDGRPEALRRHIEQSLKDLSSAQIDLYYLHSPDPSVPLEESIAALSRAKQEGLIARIGVSNVDLAQLRTAMAVDRIDAVQNRYNPAEGGDEEVLEFTAANGIAFVSWGPLAARPFEAEAPLARGSRDADGTTPAQRALKALLERSPNILPIPGTTDPDHLVENLAAFGHIRRRP